MAQYSYAIAAGWNVALVSLTNVETLLGVPPRTQPINRYPVREKVLSQREYGHGARFHVWEFDEGIKKAKLEILEDTYLTSGTVVSAQVTIYTREHIQNTYTRWNAWLYLPLVNQDYTLDRGLCRNLRVRFGLVTQL